MKSVKINSGDYQVTLANGTVWLITFDPEFKGTEKWLCRCTSHKGYNLDPHSTKRGVLAELATITRNFDE